MTTATATLYELQHDFPSVEKAAKRGPVKITSQGNVVGTFTTENKPDYWQRLRELRSRISTRGITSDEIMSWMIQGRKY